jgi:hypothetical protein
MNEYALHFALRTGRNRIDILQAIPGGMFTAAYVDGDSFVEWGEAQGDDPAHATVFFGAADKAEASILGLAIFNHLLAAFVADPAASCMPNTLLNYAITDAADWSEQVTV